MLTPGPRGNRPFSEARDGADEPSTDCSHRAMVCCANSKTKPAAPVAHRFPSIDRVCL